MKYQMIQKAGIVVRRVVKEELSHVLRASGGFKSESFCVKQVAPGLADL